MIFWYYAVCQDLPANAISQHVFLTISVKIKKPLPVKKNPRICLVNYNKKIHLFWIKNDFKNLCYILLIYIFFNTEKKCLSLYFLKI